MENIGLVLEGGGMRGVYTAGILEFFMEKDLYFPYVVGVSAGACQGASYISRQKERNKQVSIGYINHPKYLSLRNLPRERSLFGMNFIFDEIPNKLVPFDYKTYHEAKEKFLIGTTDCSTGKAVYFEKSDYADPLNLLKASSSLPFLSPVIKINDLCLLDGGISAPIPIHKSIEDGNHKNVVVLTRNIGYRKEPFKMKKLAKMIYPNYNNLIDAMLNRHNLYNNTLDYLDELEKENKAFIFRPSLPLQVGRLEKDANKLSDLYKLGYEDGKDNYENLQRFLECT